jgi:hypothetical protein
MSGPAARSLVVAAGMISLTWPIVVAQACLRVAFPRPIVAHEATAIAIPISIVCSIIATALSVRRPPQEAGEWLFRCGVAGGLLGEVWLALGLYMNYRGTPDELAGVLVRGLLVAVPIGFVVGLALGTEMAVIDRWARRMSSWRYAKTVPVLTVMANAGLAMLFRLA